MLWQDLTPRRGTDAGKVLGLIKIDAPESGKGKPCGNSFIPQAHRCGKLEGGATSRTAEAPSALPERKGAMSGRTKLLLSASGVAVISAALGVLSRDIFTTGLPPDAIPPKKVPEGLYDTFKPGDLIYNAIDFIGTNRAHYAVYVGKIDGKHSMFDVSPGKLNGGAAAVARIRTLEEGQDEKGTSFAKASRIDKSKQGPTAAQLQQIIKQLENKKFEWNGFENNCESFARAIVNDVPVSLQGKKATEATNQLTKVLLRLGAPKDFYKSAYSLRYVSQVVRAAQRRRTDAPESGKRPFGAPLVS